MLRTVLIVSASGLVLFSREFANAVSQVSRWHEWRCATVLPGSGLGAATRTAPHRAARRDATPTAPRLNVAATQPPRTRP